MDIYKEMWKIAEQIENLRNVGYYPNTDNLVSGFKHMISQLDFFYNNLVPNQGGGDYSKTYFNLKTRPNEHQLAYVELNRGYPKEIFDSHYFYILKDFGVRFLGIPVTSVKPTTCINDDAEMEIEENGGIIGILNFDEIKSIDPMRIVQNKPYVNVVTDRNIILRKFSLIFLGKDFDK